MRTKITRKPGVAFGRYCIAGTRIPVTSIAGRVWAGESQSSVARDYDLTPRQVIDALRWLKLRAMRRRLHG